MSEHEGPHGTTIKCRYDPYFDEYRWDATPNGTPLWGWKATHSDAMNEACHQIEEVFRRKT